MTELTDELKQEIEKELARRKFLNFVQWTWDYSNPYIVGHHTKIICSTIDQAIENYKNGISTFVIISVAFRHGKSELVGRRLPVFFLSHFPEREVIYVTHTADKAYEFSKDSRQLIEHNEKFKELFPDIKTAGDARNVKTWRLSNGKGKSQYFGFKSGISGSGASIVIIDDFFKNREDAESEKIQKKVKKEFSSGIMTRLADPSIVFLIGTRWNLNDLIQFCIDESKKNPKFPQLEFGKNLITMPGISDQYPSGYLFPERFSPAWYEQQMATLVTDYERASLMQCDPILDGGNLLKIENVKKIDLKEVPECRKIIVIDLASSSDTKKDQDPDYTVAMYGCMVYRNGVEHMYIIDMMRIRETAPKRNKKLLQFINRYHCSIYVEAIAGYKDTYETIKSLLYGKRVVNKISAEVMSKDKQSRAEPLEPIFDAGNFYVVKNNWNDELLKECGAWDSGKHDDQIDCLSMIYHVQKRKPVVRDEHLIY